MGTHRPGDVLTQTHLRVDDHFITIHIIMANARERDLYAAKAAFAKSIKPFANAAEMQWLHSIPNKVNNAHQNRGSSNGSKQDKLCLIIPRLYLSSWEAERNVTLLASASVTHILQV